jgi:hypothetical protein
LVQQRLNRRSLSRPDTTGKELIDNPEHLFTQLASVKATPHTEKEKSFEPRER